MGTITSKSRDRDSKYDVYNYVLDVNDGIDRGRDNISPAYVDNVMDVLDSTSSSEAGRSILFTMGMVSNVP